MRAPFPPSHDAPYASRWFIRTSAPGAHQGGDRHRGDADQHCGGAGVVVREEMTGVGRQDQAAYRAAQGVPNTADDVRAAAPSPWSAPRRHIDDRQRQWPAETRETGGPRLGRQHARRCLDHAGTNHRKIPDRISHWWGSRDADPSPSPWRSPRLSQTVPCASKIKTRPPDPARHSIGSHHPFSLKAGTDSLLRLALCENPGPRRTLSTLPRSTGRTRTTSNDRQRRSIGRSAGDALGQGGPVAVQRVLQIAQSPCDGRPVPVATSLGRFATTSALPTAAAVRGSVS